MVNFRLIKTWPLVFLWIFFLSTLPRMLIFSEFYFLRKAFNILEEKIDNVYWWFVLFFLISCGSRVLALVFGSALFISRANWALKASRYIGSEILKVLTESKLGYFENLNKEGKILSTINNDLKNYVTNRINLIGFYILNLASLVATAVFLIYNNWIFGLIIVICFLILQLTPKNFKRRLEKINTSQSLANKDYIASFSEALNNHLPLRLMNSARLLKKEMLSASQEEIKSQYRVDRFTTLATNISSLVFYSAERIFILSAILIYTLGFFQGFLRLGDVLSLPSVLGTLIHSLSFLVSAKLHQESAKNYLKIIKDQITQIQQNTIDISKIENEKEWEKPSHSQTATPSIHIQNMNFSYGDKEIFKNLNLSFSPGLTYGIMGASGVGKSTLISLILGLHDNCQGSIKIGKKEVRELSEEAIFKIIKVVDSSNFVFDTTIEENITLFDESLDPLPALKTAALLEEFESLSQQKVDASNLSEGQKQRVNLARLFQYIGDAKILILDEALSNLDKKSREKVKESFCRLKDQGYTLIFISHHIDKNDSFYDQLINLEEEIKREQN